MSDKMNLLNKIADLPNTLSASYNLRKRPSSQNAPTPPPGLVDLGPVIKAPLDSKHYKVVQLHNGLRATLVSTCLHKTSPPGSENEIYQPTGLPSADPPCSASLTLQNEIDSFNKVHLNLAPSSEPSSEENPKPFGLTSASNENQKTQETVDPSQSPDTPPKKAPKLLRCCNGPATICVTVGAGSFHDPKNTSGLAHFVEHLIFLGSKQHPEPNKLFSRVFENGGTVNATTFAEHTNFYFSCAHNAFEECVGILVDGLTNPLFRERDIRKEIEAIDSEFCIKQTCDFTRISDFLRTCAKKDHPFCKFYWGNKNTLNHVDLQNRVKSWKERYYTANHMTVCIQASMPMEKLEHFLVKHFSDIPSSPPGVKSPKDELLSYGPPFDQKAFQTSYYVAPLSHLTCLVISWTLSSEYWKNYETKPLEYIGTILQNTKPGGLKHFLRERGWMTEWNNLFVNCSPFDDLCQNAYCSLFNITIVLTDKGFEEKGDVLRALFSYLKMLSRGGVRPRIFEEMKKSAALRFHFNNWDEMLQSGVNLAVNMQTGVPPQHLLTSKTLLTKWDPQVIQKCLDSLTPKKANYCMVNCANAKICKETVWAGRIKFRQVDIRPSVYQELESVEVFRDFRLPPDGTFLSKEINLRKGGSEQGNKVLGNVFQSDKLVVTHLDTNKSPCLAPRLPSAYYSVYFSSHLVTGHASRMRSGVLDFWSRLLSDNIVGQVGHKFDHLFAYEVAVNDDGISIHVGGPRCHLIELLALMVRQVFACAEDDTCADGDKLSVIAENLRVEMIRQYSNDIYDVETLSKDMLSYLLQDNYASLFEIRNELRDVCISSGDFTQMIKKFRRRMVVSVDLQGAVTPEDALEIVNLLTGKTEKRIAYQKPAILPEYTDRATILPRGSSWLCIQAIHPAYVTTVVTNFYQVDLWDGQHAREYVRILYRLMRRRLPNQLRTQEQLGYTVRLVPHTFDGSALGLSVTVLTQPQKFNADHVDARIDAFFRLFYANYFQQKDGRQSVSSALHLDEDTMNELDRFFRECFFKNGCSFRKLSIQLEGFLPSTRISSKKQEELTGPKSVGARCAHEDDEDDDAGGINNGMYDSIIELQYMVSSPAEQKRMKREAIRMIENVTKFKTELGLLPVCSAFTR